MSRGALVKRAAGVGGVAITSSLWMPALAHAGGNTTSASPSPVPGNPALGGLHLNLPGENSEPSSITDLNGFVGIGAVRGTGTGTMADGRKLAAVNTYRTIDANRMAWQATARDVGGQIQPDTGEIIVVRKQPKP